MDAKTVILAGLVLSSVSAAALAVSSPSAEPAVRTITDDGGRYCGWPTVTRLRSGEIVVTYSGGRDGHICPWGKVRAVRSKDGGETWTKPETLVDGPLDDRDAALLELDNGDLVLFYFTSVAFALDEGFRKTREYKSHPEYARRFAELPADLVRAELGSFSMRSTDGGRTWERKVRLPASAPHGGIQLKDGRLIVVGNQYAAVRGRLPSDPEEHGLGDVLAVAESLDRGRSWRELARIPYGEADRKWTSEPYLIEGLDGTLRCYVRFPGYFWYTESRDGGKTWTALVKTGIYGKDNPAHLLRLRDGRVLLSFGRRAYTDAERKSGWRIGAYAAISSDDAKPDSWDLDHIVTLLQTENNDMAYPSTVELDDGGFLSVYYYHPDGNPNAVLGATRWHLPKVSDSSQAVVAGTCLYDDKVDYEPYFEYDTCWERDWWPVGNGRIGAMVVGGSRAAGDLRCWRLMFNCDSMWSGVRDALPISDRKSGGQVNFGRFLDMGELYIYFDGAGDFGKLSRRLDLMTGVITAEGEDGEGRKVRLETFASHPDDVIVVHGEFSKPASGRIVLTGRHAEVPRCTDGAGIAYDWTFPNGLAYAARVDAWADGGRVVPCGMSYLDFEDVTSLTVVLRARTSADMSKPNFGLDFKRIPYGPLAARPDYAALKARHVADFSAAMRRVELEIDGTPDEVKKLPTRMRVERCRKGESDPDLVATLFQYGRYLLFSCSRADGFPANLQGLWTNNSWPAWRSDYHLDINLQMNYWGADVANLSETYEPLADWLQAIRPFAERETRRFYPASRGFSLPVVSNLSGAMMRCNHSSSALWLAAELFDHYLFTQDRSYLEKIAWPFLKGATAFGVSRLKELPDGSLVVPDGWSPEHGPHEDGVAYDHQLLRECLKAVARAQAVLKDDPAFAAECADAARRLTSDRIGRWGQLQEWSVDRDVKGDEHRHASHLFAVYPGTTISRGETPELAKAAAVALDGRLLTGDARRSWTWPWRAALWARLGDGERAGEMIENLIRYNALPNLLTTHPPFQIDGNLGVVGAVAEMLVQSHEIGADGKPQVRLLPAMPARWSSGRVKGLRTRGGGDVSFVWKDGKIVPKSE